MAGNLISTHELYNMRVLGGKNGSRTIGKVRAFVFHPKERRLVGFIVKRPDVALMFHRKDLFVAFDGYDFVDGRMVVRDEAAATDKAACKRLGVSWDECVLWVGLPIICEDGSSLGVVGSVVFDRESGRIQVVESDAGATANTLLGRRAIPVSLVKGFKRGIGTKLVETKHGTMTNASDNGEFGAVLVADEAKDIPAEGGLADQAGRATAIASDKAKGAIDKAKNAADKAKPTVDKATQSAGEAVNKGAYAVGRQLVRAQGMFSAFKEEYDKASADGAAPDGGALVKKKVVKKKDSQQSQ